MRECHACGDQIPNSTVNYFELKILGLKFFYCPSSCREAAGIKLLKHYGSGRLTTASGREVQEKDLTNKVCQKCRLKTKFNSLYKCRICRRNYCAENCLVDERTTSRKVCREVCETGEEQRKRKEEQKQERLNKLAERIKVLDGREGEDVSIASMG